MSFFTRPGAPAGGETTVATVVNIDPRPTGSGRPPKQQEETAAQEEEEEEQLSDLLELLQVAAQPTAGM